jgi:hypothetical protein
MTKKNFINLANWIRSHNSSPLGYQIFTEEQIVTLADFCQEQNPNFNRDRWIAYIKGECGPEWERVFGETQLSQSQMKSCSKRKRGGKSE